MLIIKEFEHLNSQKQVRIRSGLMEGNRLQMTTFFIQLCLANKARDDLREARQRLDLDFVEMLLTEQKQYLQNREM